MKPKTLENIMAISMIVGLGTLVGATSLGMKKIALGTLAVSSISALASLAVIGYKTKKCSLSYEERQALNGEYE